MLAAADDPPSSGGVCPMQACSFFLLLAATIGQAANNTPKPIDDFELRDHRGVAHKLNDGPGYSFVVVVFLGVECPLANLYGPRLVELARAFEPRGVRFVGINSSRRDTITDLAAYARRHQIGFPLLKDVGNVIADRFGAKRTPEVFVLDQRRVVRYHG